MQLLKTIRLIGSFYQSFLLASIIITICCLSIFWSNGFKSFIAIFWFKIITLVITYYFVNSYSSKRYYYYFNLGISKAMLWTVSLIFDVTMFLILIILMNKIR